MGAASNPRTIVVKRYSGRRLYDPANRRYVSVEQLREWVATGKSFRIIDAASGLDVTDVSLA